MNNQVYNAKQFANLFKRSPKLAFEYRQRTTGLDMPEEYKTEEKEEVNREELIQKLKEREIKFFPWAKTEKLLELCIQNSLI